MIRTITLCVTIIAVMAWTVTAHASDTECPSGQTGTWTVTSVYNNVGPNSTNVQCAVGATFSSRTAAADACFVSSNPKYSSGDTMTTATYSGAAIDTHTSSGPHAHRLRQNSVNNSGQAATPYRWVAVQESCADVDPCEAAQNRYVGQTALHPEGQWTTVHGVQQSTGFVVGCVSPPGADKSCVVTPSGSTTAVWAGADGVDGSSNDQYAGTWRYTGAECEAGVPPVTEATEDQPT
jgi:hypothetical protein